MPDLFSPIFKYMVLFLKYFAIYVFLLDFVSLILL